MPQERSLYALQPRENDVTLQESYPDYVDLRDRNRTFDGLAGFSVARVGLDSGENPMPVWTEEATANYFDVLRIRPFLGRFFHASDAHGPDSAPYAVLSDAFWRTHFQSDRGVIGRTVLLNKHPFTVVGVAPPRFRGTLEFFSPAMFVPIVNEDQLEGVNYLNDRGAKRVFVGAMGHLKASVTPAAAITDLNSIGRYLNKTYPKFERPYSFSLKRPGLYGDLVGRPLRAFLTALMLLAGLILLAACANLGSLFAARAADRSREFALRLALGAGRLRLLRQMMTEAILISLVGGGIGLWGSAVLLNWVSAWQPFPQFPINMPVSPDVTIYFAALLLALASGFLFGSVPLRQILRTDPYGGIKSGRTSTAGRKTGVRQILLGVQIAICALLVTSSMVALRGLDRSLTGNFGFAPRHAMLVDTNLRMAGYSVKQTPPMQKRMVEAIGAIPGVDSVALTDWVPLEGEGSKDMGVFTDNTADLRSSNEVAKANIFRISPGYFRAADTTLLMGRSLTWHDDRTAPRVAVVNLEFARTVFGSSSKAASGYFKLQNGARIEVVGVVEDGEFSSLTEDPEPAMFMPILQMPAVATWMVVRSKRDPQELAAAIRGKLRSLDPGLPSFIETWNAAMSAVLFPARAATVALGILGLMGAMLSVTGIFGLVAYSVNMRQKELGIRMALGAGRKEVIHAALGQALKLLAFGSAAGLLLGLAASKVLAFIVYQASPFDPLVMTGAVLAMALLGLVATWIPARRALSIDPATLLREE